MDNRNLTLLTDLYQLTMMDGYFRCGRKDEIAVFDLFFRQNGMITYSVACGLDQAIDYVLGIKFGEEEISYLRSLNIFSEGFLEYLKDFKFTGDLYAVTEGTIVFPGEPIVTVKAPIIEAQFIETALLNMINFQTLIATKSAKVNYAAQGDTIMEFGLRRAQAPDAGIYGARAAVIGGCKSTSNVLAGKMFDIPVSGTHAHSWVMNFKDEYTAFMEYAKAYPDNALLLVDTFDTLKQGIPNISKKAREMLDAAGYKDAKICASGDLDEYSISSLKNQGAKIDLWGVGTKLITSEDMPALGGVYKLAAIYDGDKEIPKIKLSDNPAKITNPGFKNICRVYDKKTGKAEADFILLRSEKAVDTGKPLTLTHPTERWKQITFTDYSVRYLQQDIIRNGKLVYKRPNLKEIKAYTESELNSFWDEYKRIDKPHIYKVDLSDDLYELKKSMLEKIRGVN